MEDSKTAKEENPLADEAPSRSKDLSKTLPEDAFNNFLQGKRHMLVQDYTYAVQSLAKACELYTQHFGELAIECGEVYFLYGKALFRLSQQHAGVLGGALQDDGTEDEKTSEEEENKENESEKNDSDAENDENTGETEMEESVTDAEEKEPSESTDSPQAVTDEVQKEIDSSSKESETKESCENKPENGSGESNEDQQEPEEDDLELAWNSLETAKTIFLRQGTDNSEAQLKVAEILQLLAEISMESDNNPAAIADLKECLRIKKLFLKPDDRLLAETYYQMGLAELLNKDYTEAIENFEITMKILQLRIENLKSTPVVDTEGSFERADVEKEIEDLESVVVDIQEKIEDTKELIKNARAELEEALGMSSKNVEEGFSKDEKPGPSSKPVSNITHLLKRKKPEKDEGKESDAKRVKLSPNLQNGDPAVDK